MRVHYLSHVPFEQLGAMEGWFQERDISIGHSLLFAGDALATVRAAGVEHIWSTDAIAHETNVASVTPMIAAALARLAEAADD